MHKQGGFSFSRETNRIHLSKMQCKLGGDRILDRERDRGEQGGRERKGDGGGVGVGEGGGKGGRWRGRAGWRHRQGGEGRQTSREQPLWDSEY